MDLQMFMQMQRAGTTWMASELATSTSPLAQSSRPKSGGRGRIVEASETGLCSGFQPAYVFPAGRTKLSGLISPSFLTLVA